MQTSPRFRHETVMRLLWVGVALLASAAVIATGMALGILLAIFVY